MLQVESPATLPDMAELGGARTRVHWAILREMWSGGQTWAFREGEDLVGIAGIYPIADGVGEAWFNLAPAIGRNLPSLFRAIRLTLQTADYREIVVICTTRAGKVMARRCGFSFSERCDYGEIWTCKL
ncbi:hypothetical protein ACSSV1_001915 [Labrenzia sp. MBR-25]